SLQRALDRRLYLLLYGNSNAAPSGKPVWHFPEKVYDSEEMLRKCAESALAFVLGDLSHTFFVGNAPMGHMVIQQMENVPEPFKRFFFKSQVIDTNKFDIQKCEDFVWVTKDELLEYFPEQAEFFKKLIISWWQTASFGSKPYSTVFQVENAQIVGSAIHGGTWVFLNFRGNCGVGIVQRLPVVIPKLDPVVYAFQEFS
ncbi:hypothetical protein Gohar_025036, partial [Gossypium harknessii]|nr:hypothetical protein [Gossypium harknessii]